VYEGPSEESYGKSTFQHYVPWYIVLKSTFSWLHDVADSTGLSSFAY